MIKNLDELIRLSKLKDKKTLAVAAAEDNIVLKAVIESVKQGIINAVLVGNKEKIVQICKDENLNYSNIRILDIKDTKKAAEEAIGLILSGEAHFLMKGMLATSELLKAVLNKAFNMKKGEVLSHVMVYEVPAYHKLLFITDGGMIMNPNINDKIQIINNAIEVTRAFGIDKPKIAPLCAVETVNTSMQATIDAAVLTAMNKRGQIKNCIIDGPLALDNAVSKEAAFHKGISSEVAGDSDVLLVPNIESGNFLGKSLTYFAKAESAGIIVGAICPIVLVSRADSTQSKIYSIALGACL
jgi:phosphate butyryltransferase